MKNTDIQKIRQLLNQALKRLPHLFHDPNRDDSYCLIVKALALLPCETCGGTGDISEKSSGCQCTYCKNGLDCCQIKIPCPDCQPKENQDEA